MSDANPKKKKNILIVLLCIVLALAIVMAAIGFVARNNAMRINQDLEAGKTEAAEKLTAVSADLEAAGAAKADAEAQLAAVSADLEAAGTAKTDAETQLAAATADLEALSAAKADAETQLAAVSSDLDATGKTKADAEAQLAAVSADLEVVGKTKADAEGRLAAAIADLEAADKAKAEAEALLAVLDDARAASKQIVTTLTITPGELLASEQAIADLCKVTAFNFIEQNENLIGTALLMGGKEVFTLSMKGSGQGLYAQSHVFGKSVLFLGWDELQKQLEVMMEGMAPGSSAGLATQFQTLRDAFLGNLPSMTATPQTPEEVKALVRQVYGNDEVMINWVDGLLSRMVVTPGEFTGPNHDPATEKTELLLTQDDFIAIFDTQYMKDMLTQTLRSSNPTLTEEQLQAHLKEFLAEGKKEIAKISIQAPITALAHGEELVALEMPMVLQGTQQSWNSDTNEFVEAPMTVNFPIRYHRLTVGDVKKHSFALLGEVDGDFAFSLDGECNERDEKHWDFSGNLMAGAAVVSITGSGTTEGNADIMDFTLAVNGIDQFRLGLLLRDSVKAYDVQADLYVTPTLLGMGPGTSSLSDAKPLVSFNTHTIAQEPDGRFDAVQKATPETSLELMKMSPAEWNQFGTELNTNITQVLYAIMAELPESVLALVSTLF